jgi:hypothetical protein
MTIFDWDRLSEDHKDLLVENQLMGLATAMSAGWSKKVVPFALIGGESHPVDLDELDQQCDGVLLLDIEHGKGDDCPVLFCGGTIANKAFPLAATPSALKITQEG